MLGNNNDKRYEEMFDEILVKIENGLINSKKQFEIEKILLAKKHGIFTLIKNADIIEYAQKNGKEDIITFLKTKPIRTQSGVATIAVMWLPENQLLSCPGRCIYCPQGTDAPKAYMGVEPTTMRAKRFNYDPYKQIENRIRQLHLLGHSTDKCELIIMGGTFPSMPITFQDHFIKKCFDAFNETQSETLELAQQKNETASNRCVGLTVETRADYCLDEHITQMIKFGCTRAEIGIQTTSDDLLRKINRGHDAKANIDAIRRLKNNGLKFTAHWMPGLSGLNGEIDIDEEMRMFEKLFTAPYQPDELKIYPVLVMPGTKLHELWKSNMYHALDRDQMIELLVKMKSIVPKYVRIKRIMRDISEHESHAGPGTTNLRQIVKEQMNARGEKCNCIRCREIGFETVDNDVKMNIINYDASGGAEYFISFDTEKGNIVGFLRLRIDESNIAKVRELHVYGEMTPIGKQIAHQHIGYGRRLLKKAEEVAIENKKNKIIVTSGVGVRDYYRSLGYVLESYYMIKNI